MGYLNMASKFSRSVWRAAWNPRRRWWEVLNGQRDQVAFGINTKAEAVAMAASLKLIGSLKHMVAIVRLRTDLRASERAKYEAAVKLIGEVA